MKALNLLLDSISLSSQPMLECGEIKITLPWPPSMNTYWRHITKGPLAGRSLISERGRLYRKTVIDQCAAEGLSNTRMGGRLSVTLLAFPPDRRKRDLDNLPKGLLDALKHAGVYEDDGQIDELVIRRCSVVQDGGVRVEIRRLLNQTGAAA